jgi:hypothetical protein
MPMFKVDVVEIRHAPCTYTVEADSADQAYVKASIGDTVSEDNNGSYEVADRNVSVVIEEG